MQLLAILSIKAMFYGLTKNLEAHGLVLINK